MCNRDDLSHAVDQIRVSDAVVLLGAGVSYEAGMPLAGQIPPLVWHALDAHPAVRQRLASDLRVPDGAAKDIVADDSARIRAAFAFIAENSSSRSTFQTAFTNLNRDRVKNVSGAHDALARLVYSKRVVRVISLNWDTLLESAFARRYGTDINDQGLLLFKPHGDCADANTDWVLPHQDGSVPDEVIADLNSLAAERPRVLLIVGYSEQDSVVARRLVDPLATRWRVFRLSPSAQGEGAIHLAAKEGLLGLAGGLCPVPEVLGWEFVTFENQRGIEAAVSGERLGPRDVDACPRLPHYESARRALDLVNRVDIVGAPGCGKSITAWQLAREFNRSGRQVLRPTPPRAADARTLLNPVRINQWKSVLVIDDAQTLNPGSTEQLHELASPRLAVITGTTDTSGSRPRSVRIPAQVAVEILARDFRKRRDELLPIVHRYDSHIGDKYLDTPLERRIDEAAKSKTPWQFSFVLRGGWKQAREQLHALRDFDRADLLLALVAARQLVSLDAGSEMDEIVADAQAMGRTEEWAVAGIELLRRQRAILPDYPLRCLHIQAAVVVVESALRKRRGETFPALVPVLRRMVYDRNASVRGINWLTEHVLSADAFRYSERDEDRFFEPPKMEELLQRLLASNDVAGRRDAASLMSRLLWYRELSLDSLRRDIPTLRRWFESATAENCYDLGSLVNEIGKEVPNGEPVSSIDPTRLWSCVQTCQPSEGYVWGYFLNRLAYAGSRSWRTQMTEALDRDRLLDLVGRFTSGDLEHLAEFIEGIASFDSEYGLECVRKAIPSFQGGFASDPFKAYVATHTLQFSVLGHGIFGEQRPSKVQKQLSRQMTGAIRPRNMAAGIETCRFGDWEVYARLLIWVRIVNRAKHRSIVSAIAWDALERRSVEFWQHPPREFRLLLSSLTTDTNGQPVRSWIFEHVDQIEEIDPILTRISPESAIAIIHRGGRVNLDGHNASDWGLQALALASVAELDGTAARDILESNEAHIVGRLSRLEAIDVEHLPHFLALIAEFERPFLRRFVRMIDVQTAAEKWPPLLQERRAKVRRGVRRVLRIVSEHGDGEVKELAESLLATRHRTKEVSKPDGRTKRVNQ